MPKLLFCPLLLSLVACTSVPHPVTQVESLAGSKGTLVVRWDVDDPSLPVMYLVPGHYDAREIKVEIQPESGTRAVSWTGKDGSGHRLNLMIDTEADALNFDNATVGAKLANGYGGRGVGFPIGFQLVAEATADRPRASLNLARNRVPSSVPKEDGRLGYDAIEFHGDGSFVAHRPNDRRWWHGAPPPSTGSE